MYTMVIPSHRVDGLECSGSGKSGIVKTADLSYEDVAYMALEELRKKAMKRKYAALYNSTRDEWSIIYQDEQERAWFVYLQDAGSHAKEIVAALNKVDE